MARGGVRTHVVAGAVAVSLLCGGLPAGAGAVSAGTGRVAFGVTELISVDRFDGQADAGSDGARLSADGLHVAFTSEATDLVAGDTNALRDVFLRDLEAGTTELVSIDRFGGAADGTSGFDGSGLASVSADGRYVAFQSAATDLVAGDTNGHNDVFVRDMTAGTTTLVSVDSGGGASDAASGAPVLSDDGRTVAFWSNATDLVGGDTNAATDVFVRDLDAGTTTLVSVDAAGGPSDGFSGSSPIGMPAISADGGHVAFGSGATDLVDSDTNGKTDVFVRDLDLGVTTLVSVDAGGGPSADHSTEPALSADGSVVAFWSRANDLVAGDTNGVNDVFVRDVGAGVTTLVSADLTGEAGDGDSRRADISADGRFVTFQSSASDLVAGDTNFALDVFVRDVVIGETELVSVDSSGGPADDGSFQPSIDGAGTNVAFTSSAHDLVAGGSSGGIELFVRGLAGTPGCAPDPVVTGPFSDVGPSHPFCDEISWLIGAGITSGYDDGTYRPTAQVSRAAMAAFLYRFEGSPAFTAPGTATFTDVPTGHPFFHEIEWLAASGITGGFPDGTFRPGSSVSRQAMAAFLHRQSGEPPFTDPEVASFTDVPLDSTFFHQIEWLASTGITTGFADGTFKPGATVTRQAMAAFLQRLDELAAPSGGELEAVLP